MKKLNLIILFILSSIGIAALITACNGNPPVAPGNVSQFQPNPTATPCSGVFGNNAVETSTTGINDLFFYAQAASSTTTLEKISIYTASTSAVTFELGVYANNAGQPGSLLAETGPQTISSPATLWSTISLQSNVSLSSGVTYWLAYETSPAAAARDLGVSGVPYCYQAAGAFGSLPAFTGTIGSNFTFSLYGTTCP